MHAGVEADAPSGPSVTQTTRTAGGEWTWKVGELASVTGLAVRALHYYDQIGLLPASARGEGRHLRYTSAAVQRRYRICMLRRLSFPLEEIAAALDEPGGSSRPSAATCTWSTNDSRWGSGCGSDSRR